MSVLGSNSELEKFEVPDIMALIEEQTREMTIKKLSAWEEQKRRDDEEDARLDRLLAEHHAKIAAATKKEDHAKSHAVTVERKRKRHVSPLSIQDNPDYAPGYEDFSLAGVYPHPSATSFGAHPFPKCTTQGHQPSSIDCSKGNNPTVHAISQRLAANLELLQGNMTHNTAHSKGNHTTVPAVSKRSSAKSEPLLGSPAHTIDHSKGSIYLKIDHTEGNEPAVSAMSSHSSRSFGPFAGLKSARKRMNEGFAPPKKQARKSGSTVSSHVLNNKAKSNRGDLQTLKYVRTLIQDTVDRASFKQDLTETLKKLRQKISELPYYDFLSGDAGDTLVTQSKLLENVGLRAIFSQADVPDDIRADAKSLHSRWSNGDLDPQLFRGIDSKVSKDKDNHSFRHHVIAKDYPFRVSSTYFGAGELQNGQWWPMQICAVRDGAHGEIEGGIHGKTGEGAFSIVVSGGGYKNIDKGETVEYCGTPGIKGSPSANTNHMLKSYHLAKEIRVLRSSSAGKPYCPVKGIRYDGVYEITGFEIVDEDTAMHRFKMARVRGQGPIRYQGDGARPNEVELDQLKAVRELLRKWCG